MAVKSVSIRIEEAMLDKLGYVADYEGRSINSHVLCLIRDDIKRFEKEHGTILAISMPQKMLSLQRSNTTKSRTSPL